MNKEVFTYRPGFYTKEKAKRLEDACAKLEYLPRYGPYGNHEVRHRSVSFTVRHNNRIHKVGAAFPMHEAPEEVRQFVDTLREMTGADINYASVVRYTNGDDDWMNPHRHKEDWENPDQRVWIISTGAERLFTVTDIATKETKKFIAEEGSLITLSHECNTTHTHAVPRWQDAKTPRYSINCKAVPPKVWCCRAGKEYPADAVYVGRETRERRTGEILFPDSPFGNVYHLSQNAFREYAKMRMRTSSAFAAKVMALKGKDLLCWCRPHEADRCHARVWLELANAPKGEASVATDTKATTTESQAITAAPNRPAVARRRKVPARKEEKQEEISASDAKEATTREQVISKAVCIDCVAGLDSLPENSVACVVTSPPYNIGIKYGTHDDNRDDYLQWLRSVFVEIKRVLADDGHFFLQAGGIPTNLLIPQRVLWEALAAGFVLQNQIVWVKSIAVDGVTYGHFKPVNSKRFCNHTHEFIFHLTKTGTVPVMGSSPFADDTTVVHPVRDSQQGQGSAKASGDVSSSSA